ncbi:MAG: RidA family protein [Chloroflexi bacterium]|nr:RidA family protein [Chloroflexota bacterium]
MHIEQRMSELGIELPEPWNVPAQFNFRPVVVSGNMAYVSGHGPLKNGGVAYKGKLGREYGVEEGYAAARMTMLLMLASLKRELGDLDRVERVVKVLGMVNSAEGFDQQPAVINGASDLLVQVFGDEHGKHARSAVGMAELPMGIPVEIEMIVEVRP